MRGLDPDRIPANVLRRMSDSDRARYSRAAAGRKGKELVAGAVSCKSDTPLFPELSGRRFDSKGERERAQHLCLLQRDGTITDLRFQETVELCAAIKWRIDFCYREDGRTVYEEFKGFETSEYKMKLKLYREFGPGLLRISKRTTGGIRIVQTVMPND